MHMPPVDRTPHWRPLGADLYSTGASGAPPVRPVKAAPPVESIDRIGEGAIVRESPALAPAAPQRDRPAMGLDERGDKALAEPQAQEPPKEPIYKQLLEFIQSMWRASGSAIEIAQDLNRLTQQQRLAEQAKNQLLTYSDPKTKRSGGV